MNDVYTKFSAEVKYLDGDISRFVIEENAWDLDGERVGELLRQLMAAMGFSEQTINSVFGDDCECYSELQPCCDTTPSKTLKEVLDGLEEIPPPIMREKEDSFLDDFCEECGSHLIDGFCPRCEDPCCCCDEECSDTACLHDEKDYGK